LAGQSYLEDEIAGVNDEQQESGAARDEKETLLILVVLHAVGKYGPYSAHKRPTVAEWYAAGMTRAMGRSGQHFLRLTLHALMHDNVISCAKN
jgi:hypothetical protein